MQLAAWMVAVLQVVAQCHSVHILHRDIKPGVNPALQSFCLMAASTPSKLLPHLMSALLQQ
jgi:serine/threonine protein kinase